MTRNRAPVLLGVLVLTAFGLAPRDLAAQPTPLGPETRVDVLFGRHPGCPQVAASRQGAAEIAWDYAGLPPFDVYVRHFAANGAPTDAGQYPVRSALTAAAHAELEDLSLISYGFRVLTRVVDANPATPPKFFRRKLAPSGVPYSESPRPVGGPTTSWVWPGPGDLLYAGSYQAQQKRLVIQQVGGTGQPTGAQIVVNIRPIVDPHPMLVAIGNNSEYVVVWSGLSVAAAGSPARQVIRARRFFKDKPEGKADFDVNVIQGGGPEGPFVGQDFVVATDARTEGFAVAWTVGNSGGVSIHLRLFDFPGVERGPEEVAVPSAAGAAPVAAAFDASSHLLLLWRQGRPAQGNELQARVFDAGAAGGGSLGPVFDVASAASAGFADQACGDVAWAKDHWTIVWEGQKANAGPSGIFTRRFTKWP